MRLKLEIANIRVSNNIFNIFKEMHVCHYSLCYGIKHEVYYSSVLGSYIQISRVDI